MRPLRWGQALNKKLKYAAAIAALAAAIYLTNTNLLARHHDGQAVLLAHRGIAQRFDERDLKNDTCTAARMLPPTHEYLENTIDSMRAGFAAGADIGELAQSSAIDLYYQRRVERWDAIRALWTPLVAAVSGYCLGGGCELAMSCDLIVASRDRGSRPSARRAAGSRGRSP